MSKDPLRREELDHLIGVRSHTEFLNSRNLLYRERGYKTDPPTRDTALDAMAEESNLVRRPILLRGERIHFGSDEASIRTWLADD